MASRWGASSWTASSTWESDHLDQWVEWEWTWAWKVSGTTCSPTPVRPITTQRGITARQTRGIMYLTEDYGAWDWDSLTSSWQQQPTAAPLFTSRTRQRFIRPTSATWKPSMTAYNPRLCVQQRWRVDYQARWIPPSSPDRLLLLLWRTLDFVPLPLPTRFTWIPPFKWLWLRALMTHKRRIGSFACTFGECGTWWFILDSLANKNKKQETSFEEHSTLWDDGIGPKRSQCLYLTGH